MFGPRTKEEMKTQAVSEGHSDPMASASPRRSGRVLVCQRALAAAVAALTLWCQSATAMAEDVLVIRGVSIHGRFDGGPDIDKGIVIIRDGKIAAVGGMDLAVPRGATVIELEGGSVTPGLIDACALLEPTDRITAEARSGRPRQPTPPPPDFAIGHADHDDHAGHAHGEASPSDSLAAPVLTWVEEPVDADGLACCALDSCAMAAMHEFLGEGTICPTCGQVILSEQEHALYASGLAPRSSLVESSSEVVPHTLVIDTINFRSPDFDRLVRGGVTTVFAEPDSAAVIGPRGAVIRTAGPMNRRVLNDASDVTASFGSDSFRVGPGNQSPFGSFVSTRTRRPNSRMGVAWVFRKAFYDAEKGLAGHAVTGADAPPAEAYELLGSIRAGQTPLRLKARLQRDIEAAFRLADEFGLSFTLVEATEAYKCLPTILSAKAPVIFGPIYVDPSGVRAFSEETRESRLSTVAMLFEAGVETALTAMDLREEDGLARQAMYAMRCGVSFDEALKAVTLTPAKMLGVAEQVGSIEAGKRGDVVVWSGRPFEATSRPVAVVMDGKIVYDGR